MLPFPHHELPQFFKMHTWLRWVFAAGPGFLYSWQAGAMLSLQHAGFSLQWLPLLQSTVPEAPGLSSLVLGLSSPAACGLFPDQRLNVPLMLAGEFLSTGPPGKSTLVFKSLPYLVDIEESGLHSPHPHISFRKNAASDVPVRSSFSWRKICIQGKKSQHIQRLPSGPGVCPGERCSISEMFQWDRLALCW